MFGRWQAEFWPIDPWLATRVALLLGSLSSSEAWNLPSCIAYLPLPWWSALLDLCRQRLSTYGHTFQSWCCLAPQSSCALSYSSKPPHLPLILGKISPPIFVSPCLLPLAFYLDHQPKHPFFSKVCIHLILLSPWKLNTRSTLPLFFRFSPISVSLPYLDLVFALQSIAHTFWSSTWTNPPCHSSPWFHFLNPIYPSTAISSPPEVR